MQRHTNHWRPSRPIGFIPMCAVIIIALAAALTPSAPAQAASVSFFLDQSNKLPDGVDYLSVTLTESGDGVDVLLQTLHPLDSIAGDNFGIQAFGFALGDGVFQGITGLLDDWRLRYNKRMDGFGRFDFRLQGRGTSRTDALAFTVDGVALADFNDFFAAKVAGFEWCPNNGDEEHTRCRDGSCVTSAYFGGSDPAPVPIPPAVWLFGSALISLIGVVRRVQA